MMLALGLVPAMAEGSVYTALYSGEVTTLNYLITTTTNDFALSANLIDTLVEYDRYGQVKPSLAESWTISDDGLTWTFALRKDATWVDAVQNVVANVTANDFISVIQGSIDDNTGFTILFPRIVYPDTGLTGHSLSKKGTLRNIYRFFVIRKFQAVFTDIFNLRKGNIVHHRKEEGLRPAQFGAIHLFRHRLGHQLDAALPVIHRFDQIGGKALGFLGNRLFYLFKIRFSRPKRIQHNKHHNRCCDPKDGGVQRHPTF